MEREYEDEFRRDFVRVLMSRVQVENYRIYHNQSQILARKLGIFSALIIDQIQELNNLLCELLAGCGLFGLLIIVVILEQIAYSMQNYRK